ncbi:hypothetical protein J7M00_07810, partial [bacterium]|nr:hypothetical protein [bacterium]
MRIFTILFLNILIAASFASNIDISQTSPLDVNVVWRYDGNMEIVSSRLGNFSEIIMEDADYIWETGKPHIPVYRIPLRVGSGVSIRERISGYAEFSVPSPILPSQPMESQRWRKITTIDTNLYSSAKAFPQKTVRIVQSGVLHGDNFIILEICPIRYYPAKGKIDVADEIVVDIHSNRPLNESSSPVFDRIKKNFFVNPEDAPIDRAPAKMLVICPSYYRLSLEPWLFWKRQIGFSIDVRTPDELGGTISSIDDSINAIYDRWDGIDYLVIVGDVDDVPTHETGGSDSPTDIDYGCVDGDDYVPDILIGRISVQNVDQLDELVSRFIEYEQFLYSDTTFVGRFLFGTSDDSYFHDIVHTVHTYVRDNFLPYLDINYEELDGDYATESDVVSALDSGYTYYYYYGHGWSGGLSAPPLTFSGVSSLTNNNMYPFIVGNACSTNDFTLETSFGEHLLRQANAGAIAYIGGSNSTYWYPDSVWEIETFRHFLIDSIASAMGQCYAAFLDVMVSFPDFGHYFFDVYNLIGDPSVQLWAGIPENITVDAPPTYIVDAINDFSITLTSEGNPLINASVFVFWDDSFITGRTGSDGSLELTIPPIPPETLTLTATAFDKIPILTKILPQFPDHSYLYPESFIISDDDIISSRNDDDGMWDFGETLLVNIDIVNFGIADSNLNINISAEDSFLSIIDGDTFISIIDSGETISMNFLISIDPFVLNNSIGTINIHIEDSSGEIWEYNKYLIIKSPSLLFASISLSDTLYGDGDYFIEPGETVIVWTHINNDDGSNINTLSISAELPDYITFGNILSSDTLITDIPSHWNDTIPIAIEIDDFPDFEFPIILCWTVFELSICDTFTLFSGSPGFLSDGNDLSIWTSEDFGEWSLDTFEYNSPGASIVNLADGQRFYEDYQNWCIISPSFIIPWNAHLCFWYRLFVPSISLDGDSAEIDLWTDDDSIPLWYASEYNTNWDLQIIDISPDYYGKSGKIAINFKSDIDNTRRGLFIDDVSVISDGSFLGDAKVSPLIGENGSMYSFGITYGSTSGNPPESIYLIIDGEEHIMIPDALYDTEWHRYFANITLDEGIHHYHFVYTDRYGMHRFPEDTEFVGPMVGELIYSNDFEYDNGGFVVESLGWYWTESDIIHSGAKCWNNLGSGTTYDNDLNAKLVWHLDLSGLSHPAFSFWSNINFARGSTSGLIRDGGNIKVRTSTSIEIIEPFPRYDGEIISDSNPIAGEPVFAEQWCEQWRQYFIDLANWAGQEIDIIFNTGTNSLETSTGWFLDDVSLIDIGSVKISENTKIPEHLFIKNSPNPFNSACKFLINRQADSDITIYIFDLLGHSISKLHIRKGEKYTIWTP